MGVVRGVACAVLLAMVACIGGTTNAAIFTPFYEHAVEPGAFRNAKSKKPVLR